MDLAIGSKIVYYRKKMGLSQKDLAEKVGVPPPTLNRYEKDKREPTIVQLVNIAAALDVTPDALLGFEDPDFTAMKSAKSNTLRAIHGLNRLGQERVLEYVSALKELPRYEK